jgi:hypothetical protein
MRHFVHLKIGRAVIMMFVGAKMALSDVQGRVAAGQTSKSTILSSKSGRRDSNSRHAAWKAEWCNPAFSRKLARNRC